MFKGIRSLLPPGRPLQCRAAGDALLIQPKGRTDQAAWRFARALARDEQHTVVVVDVPGVAPDTAADALAHALADTEGSLRLVFGGGTSAEIRAAGQRIAEALGTVVVVPDGEVLPTAGGGLYIPGGHGSGWLRLRPGRPSEHDSMGFPKPRWQFSMMDRPWAASPYAVVEPLPCGVWVRGALPESADDNRRWLFGSLAADPDVMTVVLGCPGGPAVPLADVVRFWETVMPSARSRIRFVHFGPVALPQEGEALGQQLADALEHQVVLYTGMSMSEDGRAEGDGVTAVPSGVLPSGAAPDGADRTASRAGFVRELLYSPRGTEDAPPPALVGVREPLPGFRPVAPGVYEYAFDAVLEVVQSGLWMRPQTEPADGDDVRRIPAAPGERLFLYHRGSPDVAARMQALAEDALWRLGADARGEFALRPADDPAVDTGVWYAEPVAVPDPHEAVTAAIPPMTRPAGTAPWAPAPAPAAEDVPAPESAAPAAPARPAPAAAATPFQAEVWASAADDLSAPAPRAAAEPPPSLRPLSGLTAGPAPALPDGWAPSSPTESVMPQAPAAVGGPFVAAGPAAGAVGVAESGPVEGSAVAVSGAVSGAPGSPDAEGSAAVGGPFVAAGPAAGAAWSSPSSPPHRPAPPAATGPEGAGLSRNSGTPSGGSDASVSPRSADDAGAASEGTEDAGSAAPDAPASGAAGAGSGWLRSAVRAVGDLTFAGSPRAAGTDAAPEEPVAAGPTARAGAAPGADGDAEPTAAEAAPGAPSTDSGPAPVGRPALRPLPLAHPTAIFPPSNSAPSSVAPTGPTATLPTAAGPVSSPEPPTTQPPAPLPPEPSASPAPASVRLSVAPAPVTPASAPLPPAPSAAPAPASVPLSVVPIAATPRATVPSASVPSPAPPAAVTPPAPVPPASALLSATPAAATPPASVPRRVTPAAAMPPVPAPPAAATPPASVPPASVPLPAPPAAAVPPAPVPLPAPPAAAAPPASVPPAAAPRPVGLRLESAGSYNPPPAPAGPQAQAEPPAAAGLSAPGGPAAQAQAPAQEAGVRVQPVPKGAACAVPPERGIERERDWVRKTFRAQYDVAAGTVSRVMSEVPGLRGASREKASDALIDLVAVRLYLTGNSAGVDESVRAARVGPHVPLARCVASGLRRLPSYRGPAVLGAELTDAERAWYRDGRLLTEWSFCPASVLPSADPPPEPRFVIWSMTARRTGLLDAAAPDRVMFLPGTTFKVLRPSGAPGDPVLIREMAATEITADGRVRPGRAALDDLALESLERAVAALLAVPRPAAAEAGRTSRPQTPPGLLAAAPRPLAGTRTNAPAQGAAHEGATL